MAGQRWGRVRTHFLHMQGSESYFFVLIMWTGEAQTSLWLRGCTTPRVTELKTVHLVETPPCGQHISVLLANLSFSKFSISQQSNKFIVDYLGSEKEGSREHHAAQWKQTTHQIKSWVQHEIKQEFRTPPSEPFKGFRRRPFTSKGGVPTKVAGKY